MSDLQREQRCPVCGIIIYFNGITYQCFIHGEFTLNYKTGELEPLFNT
jgi:hypothetical protein